MLEIIFKLKEVLKTFSYFELNNFNGIPPSALKICASELTRNFNLSFPNFKRQMYFREIWWTAIVQPVLKKRLKTIPSIYRPISLFPVISKVRVPLWKIHSWSFYLCDSQLEKLLGISRQTVALPNWCQHAPWISSCTNLTNYLLQLINPSTAMQLTVLFPLTFKTTFRFYTQQQPQDNVYKSIERSWRTPGLGSEEPCIVQCMHDSFMHITQQKVLKNSSVVMYGLILESFSSNTTLIDINTFLS